MEEGDTDTEDNQGEPQGTPHGIPTASSGRTLDGSSVPQPIPTTSSFPPASSKAPAQRKMFATLGDLGGGGHGHDHDDDDDDDDDDPHDLFTGGEKSGLAVQNPDDIRKKIVAQAKK